MKDLRHKKQSVLEELLDYLNLCEARGIEKDRIEVSIEEYRELLKELNTRNMRTEVYRSEHTNSLSIQTATGSVNIVPKNVETRAYTVMAPVVSNVKAAALVGGLDFVEYSGEAPTPLIFEDVKEAVIEAPRKSGEDTGDTFLEYLKKGSVL